MFACEDQMVDVNKKDTGNNNNNANNKYASNDDGDSDDDSMWVLLCLWRCETTYGKNISWTNTFIENALGFFIENITTTYRKHFSIHIAYTCCDILYQTTLAVDVHFSSYTKCPNIRIGARDPWPFTSSCSAYHSKVHRSA